MMRKAAALSVAFSSLLLGCAGSDAPRVELGRPVPDYSAETLEGVPADLEDLRGQVVLLNAWATWCIPCREEIPALQALYDQRRAEGLEVVGVSVDGRGEAGNIRRFASEFAMTFPIWHDPEDRFGLTFRTLGVPNTFLIDREGVLRWRKLGPIDLSDPTLTAALDAALGADAGS